MPDQDNTQRDAATPPPVPPAPGSARGNCGNCGSPLLGEYCYACGQPVTGMVRHFSTILGDFTDTILNWDARLPRTLWPLRVRPGFLTRDYFAGRTSGESGGGEECASTGNSRWSPDPSK